MPLQQPRGGTADRLTTARLQQRNPAGREYRSAANRRAAERLGVKV